MPLVNGDFEKTQRMLENLASNAIKFTPDGGTVELRVDLRRGQRRRAPVHGRRRHRHSSRGP
ncbi:MAG: hypothetical protein V8S24_10705 [Gordonibacter pamelaeae]